MTHITACGMVFMPAPCAMPATRRPWYQALALSFCAGLALAGLGTVPGMGLPGALVMLPATPFIAMLAEGGNMFPRDSAWPFMIGLTWLLGGLLPVAWMASRRWQGVARAVAFLLVWTALAMLGAVVLYWWGIVGI